MNGLNLLKAFPDITMYDNVLAGTSGKNYPVNNFYPTVTTFWSYFAVIASGDYSVLSNAPMGSDGKRVGADFSRLPVRK